MTPTPPTTEGPPLDLDARGNIRIPKTGRQILYVLSDTDVQTIMKQRVLSADLMNEDDRHLAAFRGNSVLAGDIVPAVIIRVWNEQSGLMNGQALLDGTDSLWLLSRERDANKTPGTWHWPELS